MVDGKVPIGVRPRNIAWVGKVALGEASLEGVIAGL
jgi:hypothetical protein